MLSAPDAPPMEAAVAYTDEAIASAADGGYGIAFLPRHAIKVLSWKFGISYHRPPALACKEYLTMPWIPFDDGPCPVQA